MIGKRTLEACLICGLALPCAADSLARKPDADLVLPEIVVTPSRSSRDIQSEPSTAYRLSGSEAEARGARTMPAAIGAW